MHLQLYVLEDVTASDGWRNETASSEILSGFFVGAHDMHVLRDPIILFFPLDFLSARVCYRFFTFLSASEIFSQRQTHF